MAGTTPCLCVPARRAESMEGGRAEPFHWVESPQAQKGDAEHLPPEAGAAVGTAELVRGLWELRVGLTRSGNCLDKVLYSLL